MKIADLSASFRAYRDLRRIEVGMRWAILSDTTHDSTQRSRILEGEIRRIELQAEPAMIFIHQAYGWGAISMIVALVAGGLLWGW